MRVIHLLKGTLVFALICLAGCSVIPEQMSRHQLESLVRSHQASIRIIVAEPFSLLTVSPLSSQTSMSSVLRVYIEGDGLGWRTRHRLSVHPTPVNPLALKLMLTDSKIDKLYIARPCQFIQTSACNPRFWSKDRFAPEVVSSISAVLDKQKTEKGYQNIELVGFSGGAAVALLLAAQRSDVLSVRTISGNIDHQAFTDLHNVSPLSGSLNPVDCVSQLKDIPQIHFIGGNDIIVPSAIFDSYVQNFTPKQRITSIIINNVSHQNGWFERWPDLLLHLP